jgi:hypothetical protein
MTDVREQNGRLDGGSGDRDRGGIVASDSSYFVSAQDWPAGARDEDPSVREVYEVLWQVDTFYETAVQGLASTSLPDCPDPNG